MLILLFLPQTEKMLLPFGTIAPGILLPLLAFAYMLFFGSFALNKTVGKTDADNHEASIREIQEVLPSTCDETCYSLSPDDLAASGLEQENFIPGVQQLISWISKIPVEENLPDYNLLSHFTRPPPYLPEA